MAKKKKNNIPVFEVLGIGIIVILASFYLERFRGMNTYGLDVSGTIPLALGILSLFK